MTPTDGDLEDLQPGSRRQEQKFRIESETGNRHLLKHGESVCTPEEFEPALRVVNPQGEDDPYHKIEYHPTNFTPG